MAVGFIAETQPFASHPQPVSQHPLFVLRGQGLSLQLLARRVQDNRRARVATIELPRQAAGAGTVVAQGSQCLLQARGEGFSFNMIERMPES